MSKIPMLHLKFKNCGHSNYLLLISHGSPAKYCHLGHGLFLKALHRVSLGTKKLSNEIELEKKERKGIHNDDNDEKGIRNTYSSVPNKSAALLLDFGLFFLQS